MARRATLATAWGSATDAVLQRINSQAPPQWLQWRRWRTAVDRRPLPRHETGQIAQCGRPRAERDDISRVAAGQAGQFAPNL